MLNLDYLNHTGEANTEEKISAMCVTQLVTDLQCQEKAGTLKKCKYCGLEAHNEGELHAFKTSTSCKYGHANLCNKCYDKIYMKKANERRYSYKGKQLYMEKNIRVNICPKCGKTQEENKNRQMALHHKMYILDAPLAFTTERCMSCHRKEKIERDKNK